MIDQIVMENLMKMKSHSRNPFLEFCSFCGVMFCSYWDKMSACQPCINEQLEKANWELTITEGSDG